MSSEEQVTPTCCDCTPSKSLPESLYLRFRVVGILTFIFAGVSFGLDVTFYRNVSVGFGAWWIAVVAAPGIICCFFPFNRGSGISITVFSLFGFLAGIVGCALDGYGWMTIRDFEICVPKNLEEDDDWKGTSDMDAKLAALKCYLSHPKEYDLLCVRKGSSSCYGIDGPKSFRDLEGFWLRVLTAGVSFDCVLTVMLFIVFVIACEALCNTKKYSAIAKADFTSPAVPSQV